MLEAYRGSTRQISLTVYDTDGTTPLDLTGMTLTLRIGYAGQSAELSKAMTITSAPAGTASVTMTASDTANLNETYVLEVWITEGGGAVYPVVEEQIRFRNVVLA